jgi:hypothetical protein
MVGHSDIGSGQQQAQICLSGMGNLGFGRLQRAYNVVSILSLGMMLKFLRIISHKYGKGSERAGRAYQT